MLHKPHWTQGLELTAHHFQLVDSYMEQLIAHRVEALFDHAWGIHAIRWDTRAIAAGQLALELLEAILPDGTPVVVDADEGGRVPSLTLRELGTKSALEVFVGIPRPWKGDGPASSGELPKTDRYVKESVLVPDFAGGGEPVRVECLRPNVQLLFEGPGLKDFVTLPCARVIRTSAGQLAFDETFVPPVLAVGASPELHRGLRRSLDALLARQSLQARTPPRDASEGVQRWISSILGSFVPRVADLVHQRFVHPSSAYRVMAELLGALAPFTPAGSHRIPPFQYDHMGPMFAEMFSALMTMLDAVGASHHRQIALVRFDPTTLFGDLNEPAIFRNDFFLRVTGGYPDDLRVRVPQHFKIAAWGDLAETLRSATTGVPLRHDPRPPTALPSTDGGVYFKLERGDAFTSIVKHGQIGIHYASGLPLTDVSLFAVQPEAA
jgi:type VI secretion system protein ImpJ